MGSGPCQGFHLGSAAVVFVFEICEIGTGCQAEPENRFHMFV